MNAIMLYSTSTSIYPQACRRDEVMFKTMSAMVAVPIKITDKYASVFRPSTVLEHRIKGLHTVAIVNTGQFTHAHYHTPRYFLQNIIDVLITVCQRYNSAQLVFDWQGTILQKTEHVNERIITKHVDQSIFRSSTRRSTSV